MPLIKCPYCGNPVSDRAQKCPHCGVELRMPGNMNPQSYSPGVNAAVPPAVQMPVESEQEREAKRNEARYTSLINALETELVKVRRKKVALIFESDGVVTEESKAYLENIKAELEALAEKGYGIKGEATAKISEALENQKQRPNHNLEVAAALICAVVLIVFVAGSWIVGANSMKAYDASSEELISLVEDQRFDEARKFAAKTAAAFKPGYLKFMIKSKSIQRDAFIEAAIDQFVDERVGQINTFIDANRGRIDSFTWSLVEEAMKYRPEDSRLKKFKQQYLNQ